MYKIALILLVFLSATACSQIFPRETFLIPEGTTGYVFIFRGVPDGEKAVTKNGETTFNVPASRFLIVQEAAKPSAYMDNYYYVAADGTRKLLNVEPSSVLLTEENLADNRPFIFGRAMVSSNTSDVPCELQYETFYVGTRPILLARTEEERTKEYEELMKFANENSELLCKSKPASRAGNSVALPKRSEVKALPHGN